MAGRASVRAWNVVVLQDDKDLVHEFVNNDGLECLIKVGSEADQNYQNYILRGAFYCLPVLSARPDSAGTITNSWVLFLLCGVCASFGTFHVTIGLKRMFAVKCRLFMDWISHSSGLQQVDITLCLTLLHIRLSA